MAIGDLKGMRPAQEALAARVSLDVTLAGVRAAAPSIPLLSSVTGRMMESAEALNTDYWLGQIQEPVGFSGRAGTLARLGVDVVVEVGTDFHDGSDIRRRLAGFCRSAGRPPHPGVRRW